MLDKIAAILMQKGLVSSTWQNEMSLSGEIVKLCREYYEGQQRQKLTSEMRKMMQVTDDRLDRYVANYCEMVVSQMADRLTVDTIEADIPSPVTPSPLVPLPQGEGGKSRRITEILSVRNGKRHRCSGRNIIKETLGDAVWT